MRRRTGGGEGSEGVRHEEDGEEGEDEVRGHVAGLVIVVVGHGGRGWAWRIVDELEYKGETESGRTRRRGRESGRTRWRGVVVADALDVSLGAHAFIPREPFRRV